MEEVKLNIIAGEETARIKFKLKPEKAEEVVRRQKKMTKKQQKISKA